jgi:hypothetical protein
MGLVTEVNASLKKLAQREFRKRHVSFLSGFFLGEGQSSLTQPADPGTDQSRTQPRL